ncbi:hypothetical protein HD554DRAFT_2313631 [Boletus coccyginus]|nr:hypothetical protein HD554DRAFT_2313631 [Boletus coccyginus]
MDPTTLFELDNCKGPQFRAHSGTVIEETGHLASLFMKECAAWDSEGKVVPGRRTQPVSTTIADLGRAPAAEMRSARSSAFTVLSSSIPIAVNIGTCVLFAIDEDWYALSLIFVGIIASGLSSLVLEGAVNSITRRRLSLRFSNEYQYKLIWLSSVLLIVQCIAQLRKRRCFAKSCSLPPYYLQAVYGVAARIALLSATTGVELPKVKDVYSSVPISN